MPLGSPIKPVKLTTKETVDGRLVRAIRKKKNMTQKQFADHFEMSLKEIVDIEAGKCMVYDIIKFGSAGGLGTSKIKGLFDHQHGFDNVVDDIREVLIEKDVLMVDCEHSEMLRIKSKSYTFELVTLATIDAVIKILLNCQHHAALSNPL